ncbi:MAG: DUF2854 domain-containing protein [Pegethrix bostrychoides GSE-TBD4-15B]|jgi:hypothetical protein|uniref:DUF2854 domain-containing protein n=1 Tax=Pegethrix bostrychoides GSE-TBD4-15B TaxID=2839662 RepID=A0A951PD49_9CYAN|nr:DUF2854 domain-containing protein [Pegethrix bostrychoides GSE-TBD4-15B]
MLRQTSLGTVGLTVGSILTVVGFAAYFSDQPTLNLIGFFYGIPLLLGGLALKSAELVPTPYSEPTSAEVLALREQQATETQTQVRKDITRYRYGQEAHLDSSLSFLGLSPTDEERPVLVGLRETAVAGSYALVLEFDSPLIPLETWQKKQDKLDRFFGEGVQVKLAQPAEEQIEVTVIAAPALATAESA